MQHARVSNEIHPTAIIHPNAKLAAGVSVGPYCVIGEHVVIEEGCWLGANVVVQGHTYVGARTRIFHHASVGEIPQDMKFKAEDVTYLKIGQGNTIREFCTLNVGTTQGGGVTELGDNNWIMAYVHLAHDCKIGNHVILANAVQLGGHVSIGDWVILGGMTAVHQFVRIGAHSMTRGGTMLTQDLPPFVIAAGDTPHPHGINSEGLSRRGFSVASIAAIRQAYKILYRSGATLEEAIQKIIVEVATCRELQVLVDFLSVAGRGIVR